MTDEAAAALLREVGALMDGHFRLSSGRHSPVYVEKFRLLQHPTATERLCRLIADRFQADGPELVAGPTTGGIILSYEVARLLGLRSIFAEKAEGLPPDGGPTGPGQGGRDFQRGFEVRPGERTLIVDDVLTTGGSIREVIEAVRRADGVPIGVGVLVDRSGGGTDFGLPLFACVELDLPIYDESSCPLCDSGATLTVT